MEESTDYSIRQIIGVKMDTKSEETKKLPNIRDVLNSEEEETFRYRRGTARDTQDEPA